MQNLLLALHVKMVAGPMHISQKIRWRLANRKVQQNDFNKGRSRRHVGRGEEGGWRLGRRGRAAMAWFGRSLVIQAKMRF